MRINRIYIITLFLLLIVVGETIAQTHCYDKAVKDYLISKNELNSNDKTSIYSFEILKSNKIEDNVFGIYRIGTFSDHGLVYLFLLDKNKDKKIFLDYENLLLTLEAVLNFVDSASCDLTDSKKLAYLRKVLEIYRINEKKIPWE